MVKMYKLTLRNADLNYQVYPPAFDLVVVAETDTDVEAPALIKYVLLFSDSEYKFEFVEGITIKNRKYVKTVRIAPDYHGFRHVAEINQGTNSMPVILYVSLLSDAGAKLDRKEISLRIEGDKWLLACQEAGKARAESTVSKDQPFAAAISDGISPLKAEILQMKEMISGDELSLLQKKAFENYVNTIKEYLLERAEFTRLKPYEQILELCKEMGVEARWASSAVAVSALEGSLRYWLIEKDNVNPDDLFRKSFDDITRMVEKSLTDRDVDFSRKRFSDLRGSYSFRNRIIHERYVPTESEAEEIRTEILDFLKYLHSLNAERRGPQVSI